MSKSTPSPQTTFRRSLPKGKQYSMILTGINLGLFDYNIFPFLHSGQAEKGFNFAKLKNIALDILLEKLKSSQLNSDSLKYVESQILEILKKKMPSCRSIAHTTPSLQTRTSNNSKPLRYFPTRHPSTI